VICKVSVKSAISRSRRALRISGLLRLGRASHRVSLTRVHARVSVLASSYLSIYDEPLGFHHERISRMPFSSIKRRVASPSRELFVTFSSTSPVSLSTSVHSCTLALDHCARGKGETRFRDRRGSPRDVSV